MWLVSAGRRVWVGYYMGWLLLCCSNFLCVMRVLLHGLFICATGWLILFVVLSLHPVLIIFYLACAHRTHLIIECKKEVRLVLSLEISIHFELSGSSCLDKCACNNKRRVICKRREKILWTRGIWGVQKEREN